MSNRELAEKITDDLFSGGDHKPKAKHLRLYTEIGDNGRYMAGWSESPMATRIEHLLAAADLIPRAAVATALRELRAKLDSMMFNERHATPFEALQKAQVELRTTIAALDLETVEK